MFDVARKLGQAVGVAVAVSFLAGMVTFCLADAGNNDLIKALGSENRGWRYSAAKALGDRGAREAVAPMIDRLKVEKDSSVRIVLALALHKIGDPRAIRALRDMARTDGDGRARCVAAAAAMDMEKSAFRVDEGLENDR